MEFEHPGGNLTSNFARQFNADTPDVKHISYFSYAGAEMKSFLLKPGNLLTSADEVVLVVSGANISRAVLRRSIQLDK